MHAPEAWMAVDQYVSDLMKLEDDQLEAALVRSRDHDLPEIQVSYPLGGLLQVLARAMGARRILEVGTLGGFSTIFLARALPEGGILYSLELEKTHAAVARANVKRAGLDSCVHVLEGDASETLAHMISEQWDPFDFVFLDADKPGYASYLKSVLQLARPGTLIMADNVVREGAVIDGSSVDPMVQGVRAFNAFVAGEKRLMGTIIQTVGSKGYDGFAAAVVVS